jgi:hypothetical protein
MEAIKRVAEAKAPIPKAPPVNFNLSEEAVRFNTKLLKDNGLSLQDLLQKHQETMLGFGLEFRPLDQLKEILGQHPNFTFYCYCLQEKVAVVCYEMER